MQIKLINPKVRDLLIPGFKGERTTEPSGFTDDEANGCYAMGGKLCCRPGYQRSFVYDDEKRDKVIDTIRRGLPLNVMYWMAKPTLDANGQPIIDSNGNPEVSYELMDGQQRTLSILQYCSGKYSIDHRFFHNLFQAEKDVILDYELMVYVCTGDDKERLEWFKTVNIAGEKLTPQELLNACYSGPFVTDAKKYFSKPGGPAATVGEAYVKGNPIRQDYLELALKWICDRDNISVEDYMATHQANATALELWTYFRSVIEWVKAIFPEYRKKLMQGLPWGLLYNKYSNIQYDPAALEVRIGELLEDDDITNQKGIYEFLLSNETEEKSLHIRTFSEKDKRKKYAEQKGICPMCVAKGMSQVHYEFEEMEGDHIIPWSKGGHTTYDNLQMLCKKHNNTKSNR